MSSPYNESPFNALPSVVVALVVPIVAIELWLGAGARGFLGGPEAVGWRIDAIRDYAFSGLLLEHMVETGRWSVPDVLRLVSYPFIHWGFTHMLMVVVFVLALGKMVGEVFSPLAVLVVFFGSAIAGALAFTVLLGLSNGLVTIVKGAVPLALFGANGYGALLGLLAAPQLMASALAPVAFAAIADLAGTDAAIAALVAVSVLSFAAMELMAIWHARRIDAK